MFMTQNPEDFVVTPNAELSKSLSAAKANVSLASMMISYAMYRCSIKFVSKDSEIKTAGAMTTGSGNFVYINTEFWTKCLQNVKQRAFVLYHEILHIFLDHNIRAFDMGYNPLLWNQATDYCINLSGLGAYRNEHGGVSYCERISLYMEAVDKEKFSEYLGFDTDMCYDESFLGMSADEIYRNLMEEAKEGDGSGSGKGEGDSDEKGSGGDSPNGRGQSAMDEVVPTNSGSEDVQRQQVKNNQTIVAAASIAAQSKTIGASEQELRKTIMKMIEPVVDWKEHLQSATVSKVPMRTTYNRISRRSGQVIFPTYNGDHMNIMVGVDSSGSMSMDDFTRCYSETVEILNGLDSWDMWLVTCDTKAHLIGHMNSEEYQEAEDINFNIVGGGGTDMRPLLDYADELVEVEGVELDVCLVMTDGYIPEETVDEIIPATYSSLFLVTDSGNKSLNLENHEVIFVNN